MQSLVLMTVLSGAAHAPEQYWTYGPCGYTGVYYGPVVAYSYPVQGSYAAAVSPSTRQKLDDLSAQISRISDRLGDIEARHRDMEAAHREMKEKHRQIAAKHQEIEAGMQRKFEEHTRQMEKVMEARLKEERVRQELAALREKTQSLETGAKTLNMIRAENVHQQLAKLENQIRKLEAMTGNQQPTKTVGNRSPEANFTFEASEDPSSAEVPDNRALIVVTLPEKARLFVNGQMRKGNTGQRFILTPQLEDGDYYYTLRMDIERDGRVQSQTRQISFRRGVQVRVNFD